ncbi:hypothetical protein [Sphingomonas sanguinis]|nr:hypothetical protein [Sphingomonas sanguinis]
MFATPSYIAREMHQLFAGLGSSNGFRGLSRNDFSIGWATTCPS